MGSILLPHIGSSHTFRFTNHSLEHESKLLRKEFNTCSYSRLDHQCVVSYQPGSIAMSEFMKRYAAVRLHEIEIKSNSHQKQNHYVNRTGNSRKEIRFTHDLQTGRFIV